ncbi:hypothetical protein LJC57_07435, partial [Parabacteroides sp. OttesenSCG-928-G07]|nr:hypothetical protein [Parabacteroides sp. OttesenSCG-928-G07]
MKNLSYLVLALFISVIGFSCSSDEAAEIIKPEQKELISLSLKASLGVDDTETKADDGISYPLNKYLLDYIYLRNGGAETALRIPVSNNDTRDFELNLSTTEDGKIKISSGENSITVADGTMLYFTSVPTDGIEAEAYPANVFETPLGNTVYKEHGRDIYKSEQFPVKIIDEGFEFLKATYYTGTEVNHFRL